MSHGTQRIKAEKRAKDVAPAPGGLTRRRFLTFLGTGSAALAAGSAGVLPKEAEAKPAAGGPDDGQSDALFFTPIEPSAADELVLPEGYAYTIVAKWGDTVPGTDRLYGYNNDWTAYYPIDALEGGESSTDGLLAINHEYPDPKWVSEYRDPDNETEKTPDQILEEKRSVGLTIMRVRRENGTWSAAESEYNRRLDATTPMDLTGPAAGSDAVGGATEVIGTLANCSGGWTPWNTILSCEENFQDYYGESTAQREAGEGGGEASQGDDEPEQLEIADTYRWLDDPDTAQAPEGYGWVVEIDPFDVSSKPRKHSWLGRFQHENTAVTIADDGRVVVYTGHDANDERIYKFVSSGAYDPNDREANMELLTDGMLYVANFASATWIPLDFENNPIFRENGFSSQADVLVRTAEAAALESEDLGGPLGTPLDRPEDIEVDPKDGRIYAALTNNTDHGNFYGQILRMREADDDAAAETFTFEVFAAGGPNTGFASPDNLAFDNYNNLWVVTDMSSSRLNQPPYETFKNNGAFVLPSVSDDLRGDVYQFASGPVECEVTGPTFTPDGSTLFLAVQHPGEETEDVNEPTSTWPDGDIPRPAVVAITGFPAGMPGAGSGARAKHRMPKMPAAGNGGLSR
jgi:secreted PhoX family phosphatase